MKKTIVILFALAALCSCSKYDFAGMLGGSGPDVNRRFANSRQLNLSNPLPDMVVGVNDYQAYVVTDIHTKGECPKLVGFVSLCLADTTAEKFVLCLGDMVGAKDSFKYLQRDLQPLFDAGWSFFTTPGNHDINFGLYSQYQEMWPRSTYKFRVVTPSAGTDLFIVLDSAEGKIGTDQRTWLEETLSAAQKESFRNIYVLTHTHFFKKDNSQFPTGNYALQETLDLTSLFAKYGVDYVLSGHDHYYEHTKFRGVEYYVLSALCNEPGSCYLFTFGNVADFKEIKLL